MGRRIDKALKGSGLNSGNSAKADDCSTPEPYSCTGNFADDFVELWIRSGLDRNHAPLVRARAKCPVTPPAEELKGAADEEDNEKPPEEPAPQTYITIDNIELLRPSMQVECETEETKQMQINHLKELYIRSWKLEEKVIQVLKLCSLDRLHSINLWNVGLEENALKTLANMAPALPNLKTMVLDGNPMPRSEAYYLFISNDNCLQHLSLRNNQITDHGAEMIGKCLGNISSQARCLTSLNLNFNQIGDKGAAELAAGLRLNRVLLSLSLASNQICDEGCKALAHVLQRFPLNHEEVVQRRKIISQQGLHGRNTSAPGSRRAESKDRPNSNKSGSQVAGKGNRGSSKKKTDPKKPEAPEKNPKKDDGKKKGAAMSNDQNQKGAKGKKSGGGKETGKRATVPSTSLDNDVTDVPEFVHPLIDPHAEHSEGKVFVPGCLTLVNLNLSRNKIGVSGMDALLNMILYQSNRASSFPPTAPGLLKINVQKNLVASDHPSLLQIQEVMTSRDPAYKPEVKTPDDDMQSVLS